MPKIGTWLLQRVMQVASWFGLVAGIALIPVYLFYLLLEKRAIQSNWKAYLPLKDSELKTELAFILASINDYLIAFFRGQVLVAICDGVMSSVGFLIIGLPYALLVGLLGGSVNGSSGRAVMAWFREGERGLAMSIRQTAVPAGGGLGVPFPAGNEQMEQD